VRIATGVLFITFSIGKFADHAKEAADFDRYGVPFPDVAVYLSGTIELVCGVLLILGLLTRIAAALLAVNLVVAIATAGRVEGGSFHLGVGPAMLLAMLFLVWAGAGALALDRRLLLRLQRS
jgi:putative oxidoreductase